jgi:hypothetical protein
VQELNGSTYQCNDEFGRGEEQHGVIGVLADLAALIETHASGALLVENASEVDRQNSDIVMNVIDDQQRRNAEILDDRIDRIAREERGGGIESSVAGVSESLADGNR